MTNSFTCFCSTPPNTAQVKIKLNFWTSFAMNDRLEAYWQINWPFLQSLPPTVDGMKVRQKESLKMSNKTNTSSKGMTESKYWPYCSSMLCEIETRSRYSSSWGEQLDKESVSYLGGVDPQAWESRNPGLRRVSNRQSGSKICDLALSSLKKVWHGFVSRPCTVCSNSAFLHVWPKTFQLIRLNSKSQMSSSSCSSPWKNAFFITFTLKIVPFLCAWWRDAWKKINIFILIHIYTMTDGL